MVSHGSGDAFPGGVVLGSGAQAQQTAKIFHSPAGLALFIDVKAVHHQGLAVVRHLGFGGGHHPPGHLHAQVLIQGHKRQLRAGALDDVAARHQTGFLMRRQWRAIPGLCIQKLGHHPRDTAGGVFTHQGGKCCFRVVTLQQRGHFKRLGRLRQVGPLGRHLQATHHIASNHRQQCHWARTNLRTKLLLQHLQQIPFGQVHLQHRWQLVVPHIALGTNRHGQRHKIFCRHIGAVAEHALEVARLFQRGHLAAQHVHSQLHQRLSGPLGPQVDAARSRRSASKWPPCP